MERKVKLGREVEWGECHTGECGRKKEWGENHTGECGRKEE